MDYNYDQEQNSIEDAVNQEVEEILKMNEATSFEDQDDASFLWRFFYF